VPELAEWCYPVTSDPTPCKLLIVGAANLRDQGVGGSNPLSPTNSFKPLIPKDLPYSGPSETAKNKVHESGAPGKGSSDSSYLSLEHRQKQSRHGVAGRVLRNDVYRLSRAPDDYLAFGERLVAGMNWNSAAPVVAQHSEPQARNCVQMARRTLNLGLRNTLFLSVLRCSRMEGRKLR
jgi:hypothetical protein